MILQKSNKRKGTDQIQFRIDVSKSDRAKLYEELQAWHANCQGDLVIKGNLFQNRT